MNRLCLFLLLLGSITGGGSGNAQDNDRVEEQTSTASKLDNGVIQIGVDRDKGAAITWLSSKTYPKNMVNVCDPGRLIQQSYYAGERLDRRSEGQSPAWSPWSWNPIQGGGVGSWARVTELSVDDGRLFSETIPKLWDMPDEEAAARMRQWTSFELSMPNVIVVECEIVCMHDTSDRWGPASLSPQEIPACYFTRNFDVVRSYLGNGQWSDVTQPPGPPWGQASPPLHAMACFEIGGQGIAIFSPTSTELWNFGPHGVGPSDDPKAGPCVHLAPIARVLLGPQSSYRYRYWIVMGNQDEISSRLDLLWQKYSSEVSTLKP